MTLLLNMKSSGKGEPNPKPASTKLGLFAQLGQDCLLYFNKQRTVRNAKYRIKAIMIIYISLTVFNLSYYIGSPERFADMAKK